MTQSVLPESSLEPLSRREQKRVDTHEALINAAMSLLSTRGFDATTVDDIAAAAGISRRTLFRYFPTKADIVTAWTGQMTAVLTRTVENCPPECPPQTLLAQALEAVIPHIAPTEHEAFAFVFLIERTPALLSVSLRKYAQWEDSLATALARRLPNSRDRHLAARVTARSGIAAFRTALDEWIRLNGTRPVLPILRQVLTLQAEQFSAPETAGGKRETRHASPDAPPAGSRHRSCRPATTSDRARSRKSPPGAGDTA
ncbi:transcriptional regulator [Ameyamaea chiangmaiensis NBRC 103196]|uniref:TetR family transcriptional regulator n=1 Tax=Ameyamaea chiangmaiensis TaxID=442969 RepID=A0A850PH34_9PROT|nr:TetR family transcriptional regulator [Ameyamaea chiangmaiensis]MBS4075710.1 TetR family transcriptional regulator [Ameyamaea chiangmaiensis]NVN41172.1 TetR family transcriptional regulator [Ameyamaea chiangmaiensis]GBQ70424.1 transcriptional regulator [Ameyamaea chiangmaiensis NBRC 103196]